MPESQMHEAQEVLRIRGGLGPIQAQEQECKIAIHPLTIFIGPQGTGKSLVSQLLYFLRDAQYLLATYSGSKADHAAVRKAVEGLRTGDLSNRPLSAFLTTPSVRVEYEQKGKLERAISIYKSNNRVKPLSPFVKEVEKWFDRWLTGKEKREYPRRVWFIPAERMFFSRFINTAPGMMGHAALPYSMREFAQILTQSGEIYQQQTDSLSPVNFIKQLVYNEMRGEVHYARRGRYAGKWQWKINDQQAIEVEMASSGQMEAWPLVFAAQSIFRLDEDTRPRYMHIEEPEAHLHPNAQVAIAKVIAYLVNQGVNILITTHSLTMLYAFNNLVLAHQTLGASEEKEHTPPPPIRLNPKMVSAYLFDGTHPQDILDPDSGQIDEGQLGKVLGNLEAEFNRIATYNILWE